MAQFRERGGNFGMTEGMKEQTPEFWTSKIFEEFFGDALMQKHEKDIRQNPTFQKLTQQPSGVPQAAPAAPVEQPAPQPLDRDPEDPLAAIAAQAGVSSKLADKLSGARWDGVGSTPYRGADKGTRLGYSND